MTNRQHVPFSDSYITPEEAREAADERRVRGLSDFRMAIISYGFVVIGLIGSSMVIPSLGPDLRRVPASDMFFALLFEICSWCALPIVAWLTVESARYASHPGLHALRLLALAIVSEVPYDLSTTGMPWDWNSQNPVWAMAICVVLLWIYRHYAQRGDWVSWCIRVLSTLAAAADMLLFHVFVRQTLFQGGLLLLGFVVILYSLRNHENTMMLTGVVWGMGGLLPPSVGMVFLHYRNGLRGYPRGRRGDRITWMLYVAYPLLLLVFGLIRLAM